MLRKPTPHIESPLAVLPTTKHPRSRPVIVASLCADGTLAVVKCIAAALSGSAAMFAEALHSIADTTNQSLLLVGLRLGARPADEAHPYGYGMERFFWPFVVSMVVCSVGVQAYG
jgi:divalent metal cation (Fe/Co/Zn/Cd) transporter